MFMARQFATKNLRSNNTVNTNFFAFMPLDLITL